MSPKRGELYQLKPGLVPYPRPIVIVSRDELNHGDTVIAIPFYSQQLERRIRQPWCASFKSGEGGLTRDCVAKTDEIGAIPKIGIELVAGRIGRFDPSQLDRLMDALAHAIGIYDYDPNA